MSSLIMEIAEAVKDALNDAPDGTFPLAFTAVRAGMIEENLSEIQSTRVTVLPFRWTGEITNRVEHEERPSVAIAVQRGNTEPKATDKIDTTMELVQKIIDYMRAEERRVIELDSEITIEYIGFDLDPPYLFNHLAEFNTFTSIPAINYRLVRL